MDFSVLGISGGIIYGSRILEYKNKKNLKKSYSNFQGMCLSDNITGGGCSAYGETTHGNIDSLIYSTEHTLSVRVAGAISTQTFTIYATGMFLID